MKETNCMKMCRLCIIEPQIYFDIFSEIGIKFNIKNKIETIFRFDIQEKDVYPLIICDKCVEKIDNIWEYFNLVIHNQKYLTELKSETETSIIPIFDSELLIVPKSETLENDNISEGPNLRSRNKRQSKTKDLNFKIETENDDDSLITVKILDDLNEEETEDYNIEEKEKDKSIIKENKRKTKKSKENGNKHLYTKSKTLNYGLEKLPEHLKTRMTKSKGDKQIREFSKLKCDICSSSDTIDVYFETFKEIQIHFKNVHKSKGYVVCCDKRFYRKDRLMSHIINHINPDAFKCPDCGQISKSKLLLRIHMKQHLPVNEINRPYECHKCGQRFVLKSQLTNHEASHLLPEQKKFKCDECGKAFALKFVMIKHKLTHTKECNYVCEICAKSFVTKSNLQAHLNNHNDEPQPKVQCKICEAWYKNIDTLRTHMRKHRDESEVYICSTCGKNCTSKSSLTSHIRYVHLKISEFECKVCKRQFRRKLELKEHLSRHTGESLYQCQFCQKNFTSSSNYFSHRKNRHPDEYNNKNFSSSPVENHFSELN